jgi:hypothetical protein
MKTFQTLTALSLILATVPALAQTPGLGQDATRDQSTGATKQEDLSKTRTLEQKRGAGIATTINASTIVLAGMAALPDDGFDTDNFAVVSGVCNVAGGYRDDQIASVNKELDAIKSFDMDMSLAHWDDLTGYQAGDTISFRDSRDEMQKRDDEFNKQWNAGGGGALGKRPVGKPQLDGNFQVAELHVKDGWIGLTGPGIEKGKVLMWRPAGYVAPVGHSRAMPLDDEHRANVAKYKAQWRALTPEQAAPICAGARVRQFVVSDQIGWPVPQDQAGTWARAATMHNLVWLSMAKDIAQRIEAVKYKDADVAIQHATLIATQVAPIYMQKFADLVKSTDSGNKIKISLNYTGKCGEGWSAIVGTGAAYEFCGNQHGYNIEYAGGPWAGEGWLAGAMTQINFSQSGSATVTEADAVTHSKVAAFMQSVKVFFNIGH